jgi:ATP-dependent DNA ligase
VFDILALAGTDVRSKPYATRRTSKTSWVASSRTDSC